MKKFLIVAGVAATLIVVLTGCGSTPSATAPPPTPQAPPPATQALATSIGATNCLKEGWMVFVGERETVYGCADVSQSERCYVYIDGTAEDVTDSLADDDEAWPCTSDMRAEAAHKVAAANAAARASRAAKQNGFSTCSHSKWQGEAFRESQRDFSIDEMKRAGQIARMLADQFHAPALYRERWITGCLTAVL